MNTSTSQADCIYVGSLPVWYYCTSMMSIIILSIMLDMYWNNIYNIIQTNIIAQVSVADHRSQGKSQNVNRRDGINV